MRGSSPHGWVYGVSLAVTHVMSRCQCMCLKPLFTTDMNRKHLAETRRGPVRGGSASASLRLTVSARCFRSIVSRYYLWNSSAPKLTFFSSINSSVIIFSKPFQHKFYFRVFSTYMQQSSAGKFSTCFKRLGNGEVRTLCF